MLFLYFFIANYTTYQKTTGYDFITIKQKIKDKKKFNTKKSIQGMLMVTTTLI